MYQPKKWWIGLPIVAALVYFAERSVTPAVEADIARRIEARLARAPGAIDNPQVSAKGRDVTVAGVGLAADEKSRAIADLRREDGVRALTDSTSALVVAKPFVLTLERNGPKVTMTGNIPVAGEREKLRAEIAAAGLEVADKTAHAAGAPTVFRDLAQFSARRLAELDPAKATLTDDSLAIAGEARSGADYDKAVAALKSPPPGARVMAAEIAPPRVTPYVFSAAAGEGMISLSGHIPTSELRRRMVAKAASLGAGAAVSDATQIGSGAPKGDYAGALAFALAELGKLAQGKVSIVDAKVSVEGQGRDNVRAATIEVDAKDNLPKGFELARVDVAAGPVSPYVFSAQKNGGAVTLAGYVPDEVARGRIVDGARRGFFDASIVDNLAVAKGAPQNFVDAVATSMHALARLADGKLSIAGGDISLQGAALHQSARAEIEQSLAQSLPQGFRSDARLSTRTAGSSLDAGQCRAALAEILTKTRLAFEQGDMVIAPESEPVVDALAAIVLRCQDMAIEVAAHTDPFGIAEVNRDLTKRRAQAIVDRLVKAGADAFKLTAVGYGGERPIGPGDSDENRARNRRIEFVVK
jgi:OOP family OmpA-OmpF porin